MDQLYTIFQVAMLVMMAILMVMLASYVAAYANRAVSLRRRRQTFTLEQVEAVDLKTGSHQMMRFDEVTGVRMHTTFLQNLIHTGNITFESDSGATLTLTDITHHKATTLELMALCPRLPEAQRFAQGALINAGRSWRPRLQLYAARRDIKFVGQNNAGG